MRFDDDYAYGNSSIKSPDEISKKDMRRFGDQLEAWLNFSKKYVIIPDELQHEKYKIDIAVKKVKKLIKKLRKGDKSIFRDELDY